MIPRINWDRLGIAASLACAIHCAVIPLFFTSLPLWGINLVTNEAVEYLMIGLAFLIGLLSFRHGFRLHHHKYLPVLLFTAGIGLLIGKEMVPGHPLWMIMGGIALIVSAHYVNYRFCRKANHCHSSDCNH